MPIALLVGGAWVIIVGGAGVYFSPMLVGFPDPTGELHIPALLIGVALVLFGGFLVRTGLIHLTKQSPRARQTAFVASGILVAVCAWGVFR